VFASAGEIAAVIVEPYLGNVGFIRRCQLHEGLRALCDRYARC